MRPIFCLLLLIWACVPAHADKASDLRAHLGRLGAQSTLYAPALKPWHMKMAFTLYDDDGTHPVPGFLEEWWAGPDQDRITYSSAKITGTSVRTLEGDFRSAGMTAEPYALEQLHRAVVEPGPSSTTIATSEPQPTNLEVGKIKLDCIMLPKKGQLALNGRAGTFPTYCYSAAQDELRVSLRFMVESVLRNGMGRFEGQSVATQEKISLSEITIGEARVTTLQTMPAASMDFSTAGLEKQKITNLPSDVVAGKLLHTVPPLYPDSAKAHHISGVVLLRMKIGTDGRVKDLGVRYTSSSYLTSAAEDAVKQWVYTPFQRNGQAVEVDTTAVVEFNIRTAR